MFIEDLQFIMTFIINNFLAIWPYLLLTIPLSVAVNLFGGAKYINRIFTGSPYLSILLATAVGAFSPFCSCSVIPVIAALLISGVPLAPVMAFWLASPSMDLEVFFLSVGMLGWELAIWRLIATVSISIGAGVLIHIAGQRGWLGSQILRSKQARTLSLRQQAVKAWQRLRSAEPIMAMSSAAPATIPLNSLAIASSCGATCGTASAEPPSSSCNSCEPTHEPAKEAWQSRIVPETVSAVVMVVKFMLIAFLLEALITLYVPQEWIVGLLGEQNILAVPLAAIIGIPIYTSNLTALPLVGSMLNQGMHPGAAVAFLVAGPMTTLPAMTAVWQLAAPRVFAFYVGAALIGAIVFGYLVSFFA